MAEYPYTPNPANVGRFLGHIQDSGVPSKVAQRHLESVGFKSKNDRYLIGVLKSIGFMDSTGVPSVDWRAYKDRGKAKQVLAKAVSATYSELFAVYPDAYRKDDEALRNFFASSTGLAKGTVERMVRTFKVLCERADFEVPAPASKPPPAPSSEQGTPPATPMPSVNINIQLHLPPTDDASVYDKLFAAMKKHLFS